KLGAAGMLAVATYFCSRHIRLQPLFCVVAVVVAGSVLSSALAPLARRLDERLRSIFALAACGLLAVLVGLWSSDLISNRAYVGKTDVADFGTGLGWWFPEGAADFIERQRLPGEIFNSYSEGG